MLKVNIINQYRNQNFFFHSFIKRFLQEKRGLREGKGREKGWVVLLSSRPRAAAASLPRLISRTWSSSQPLCSKHSHLLGGGYGWRCQWVMIFWCLYRADVLKGWTMVVPGLSCWPVKAWHQVFCPLASSVTRSKRLMSIAWMSWQVSLLRGPQWLV